MRKIHKNIYYFDNTNEALLWARDNNWPARLVKFELGYAIQAGISGNYAGPGITPRKYRGLK